MPIIDDPREQTTAATDLLIAALALGYAADLLRQPGGRWRPRLWAGAFGTLALAGGLGAAAHGLRLSERASAALWRPLYLALGQGVALFVAGAIHDGWGPAAGRRALPLALLGGLGFFAASQRLRRGFIVFVAYEASALLFALAVYARLARAGRLDGSLRIAAGVLLSILAAAVQATDWELTVFGVPFDHNGLFHLVQMAGLPLLAAGLHAGMAAGPERA